ncbi:MAG: hypothetical protein A3F94_02780 [Candidatus Spechtbacteria bacterium RIFCSPLOWO2_12_FULL_38_22]|uniref:Polymerase nucleotidyl transferase domain-containing protein n=1 Tax=Candidatus Spechtbacteria bacterium RIFCSPLOWO2_12_FULL_38_22 TaxID=1802165 RepID=A0A1G2HIC2_9BACT|nr:MAG: hypothetical protein A2728_03365 [Candidatus Spechtbacteria bacterium RIFCSPHIGHO2_01_FULL_38_11]OGZ60072.1 MAG: hypothetical protein A3E58_01880 [Candidatus Spechtbacteria bacterium RIFCSPHIGHO2_12_FULL_38_30]OGZ60361.1 MAG: hypothetical protein A3A00_03005 [Candidatus Spechtbacteria bacterium RIFCSPLOWO2_01_FULL_38_20]OGZ62227.1 MAG: hypothetical protein A3F94_02780 [Candidatus Spechtbacteria bacterium RIFCSPLOWO2_12_FULL_38_22]
MITQDVLKTLAYFQALADMPLTLLEIKKYLIKEGSKNNTPLFDIQKSLNHLIKTRLVCGKNGFFYFENARNNKVYINRIEKIKNTHGKWRKFNKINKFLMYIPYIRSISLTGSVALNNASPKSDLDILIESRKNRIWTVRLLTTAVSAIFLRRRYAKKINNKLCFNRYMVENSDLGPTNINHVVKNRVIVWKKGYDTSGETIYSLKPNIFGFAIKTLAEFILNITAVGFFLEKVSGALQIKKIKHNLIEYPRHITPLTIPASNIFFYYPSVLETEKKCKDILSSLYRFGHVSEE